jgi:hypothetical protein
MLMRALALAFGRRGKSTFGKKYPVKYKIASVLTLLGLAMTHVR